MEAEYSATLGMTGDTVHQRPIMDSQAACVRDATDVAQQGVVDALGADLDGVTKQLDAWSQRCAEARTFPPDIRKRAAG